MRLILPVTINSLGLPAYNWRTLSIVWFLFQSVYNKQYTNSMSPSRDLIVITVFFFHTESWFNHRLIIHVIALQIRKKKSLHRC